jgi:hypothetical protein
MLFLNSLTFWMALDWGKILCKGLKTEGVALSISGFVFDASVASMVMIFGFVSDRFDGFFFGLFFFAWFCLVFAFWELLRFVFEPCCRWLWVLSLWELLPAIE